MSGNTSINLARIYYPVTTLGPGQRIAIWLAGCDRDCPECISPELKSPDSGTYVAIAEIMTHIERMGSKADGFTISGGEPFYYPKGLRALVEAVLSITNDIIIFTGYTLSELKELHNKDVDYVLDNISVLIDGPYIAKLACKRGLRGSSNQQIHVFKNSEKYTDIENWERGMQVVVNGDRVITIGIPSVDGND